MFVRQLCKTGLSLLRLVNISQAEKKKTEKTQLDSDVRFLLDRTGFQDPNTVKIQLDPNILTVQCDIFVVHLQRP